MKAFGVLLWFAPLTLCWNTDNSIERWSQDPATGESTFKYCFASPKTYKLVGKNFGKAVKLWQKALKEPGKRNGHSLRIKHVSGKSNTAEPYCYIASHSHTQRQWNSNVPAGTYVIAIDPRLNDGPDWNKIDTVESSTFGYRGSESASLNGIELGFEGRSENTKITPGILAREIGHALGLLYEHQRADRDQNVRFNCTAVKGYGKMIGFQKNNMKYTVSQICEVLEAAKFASFTSVIPFIKYSPSSTPNTRIHSTKYDFKSIMRFSSLERRDPEIMRAYPLLNIKASKVKSFTSFLSNPLLIKDPNQISKLDMEGIKYLYPWDKKKIQHATHL